MTETKPKERRELFIAWAPFINDPLGPCVNIKKMVCDYKFEHSLHVREVGAGLVPVEDVKPLIEALKDIHKCKLSDPKHDLQITALNALATFRAKHPELFSAASETTDGKGDV